jgi:excisionase family DNA binding protein
LIFFLSGKDYVYEPNGTMNINWEWAKLSDDIVNDIKYHGGTILTIADVAARLNVSQRTVERRIRELKAIGIHFARPGRSYVFTEADYQQLFEAMKECRINSYLREPARIIRSGSSANVTRSSARALNIPPKNRTKKLLNGLR